VTLIHATIALCFTEALRRAGPGVEKVAHHFLVMKGISDLEFSARFDEVEKTLQDLFGVGGKLMIVATLTNLCKEYSSNLDLAYGSSLHNRLNQLLERIIVDRLSPKHSRREIETASFEDKSGMTAGWTG
jgi:hypothetical protein